MLARKGFLARFFKKTTKDENHKEEQLIKNPSSRIFKKTLKDQVEKLKSENKLLCDQLSGRFFEIYERPTKWDSEESIDFLQSAVQQLTDRISATKLLVPQVEKSKKLLPEVKNQFMLDLNEQETALDYLKTNYQYNLKERTYVLRRCQDYPNIYRHIRDAYDLASEATSSFVYAIVIFRHLQFASKIPLENMLEILQAHKDKGINFSASRELNRWVRLELIRRINADEVSEDDKHIEDIIEFFGVDNEITDPLMSVIRQTTDNKVEAFEKIYTILHHYKPSFIFRLIHALTTERLTSIIDNLVSQNFLDGKDALTPAELKKHLLDEIHKDSICREAWRMASDHHRSCTPDNPTLFTDVYFAAFDKSILKKSTLSGEAIYTSKTLRQKVTTFTPEQIREGWQKDGSRTATICDGLNTPAPPRIR